MAYEDFTTYIQVDPYDRWSTTTTRTRGVNIQDTEDSYVYKDYGADYFQNFIQHVDIHANGWNSFQFEQPKHGIWGVVNTYGNRTTMSDYIRLIARPIGIWNDTNSGYNLVLEGSTSDTSVDLGYPTLSTDYYLKITRDGNSLECKIYPSASDRTNDTNVIDTMTVTCSSTLKYRYLESGFSEGNTSAGGATADFWSENLEFVSSSEISPTAGLEDGVTLSDDIYVTDYDEREESTITLSDDIYLNNFAEEQNDTVTLSDEIYINDLTEEFDDIITLSDDIFLEDFTKEFDILNKFNTKKTEAIDIINKFNFVIEVVKDFFNIFNMVFAKLKDITNDIRTKSKSIYNISNDFRMIKQFQTNPPAEPGDPIPPSPPLNPGFQSLGKNFIKVYINSIEQTDVDIDSISIDKSLNSSHIASFNLGKPYDDTKPTMEHSVEIKYNDWRLYYGYITSITPTDNPESIKINCNNKYWKDNKTNKYFFVGHIPQDNQEKYVNTIQEGLAECSYIVDIGDFIPQTIDCFGRGTADCITTLVSNSGNYGWFYKEDETRKLWIGGQGDIIDIEPQKLNQNINLYNVLRHQFDESVENIVNKFRVQMGESVIRSFNESGGTKTYTGYRFKYITETASPAWSGTYERLASNSLSGYGFDHYKPEDENKYKDVYKKWNLPYLNPKIASWSDRYEPVVETYRPGWFFSGVRTGVIKDGFTIDYKKRVLIFNERLYNYITNSKGIITSTRAPIIKLKLQKKEYYSYTVIPTEDPETDISNVLMFFTDKLGSYADTIIQPLYLSQLSIQEGGTFINSEDEEIIIPSWDDTAFAIDYANWKLTENADKKVRGSIDITLDAMMFYDIDLSKRIMINGVIESPLNITSISYNLSDFTVSLNLENFREYRRTENLPSRGE